MRLILTQPAFQFSENRSHIRGITSMLERSRVKSGNGDVLVLPELIGGNADRSTYISEIRSLAHYTGAWVVGGSHYLTDAVGALNCGVVSDPGGRIIASYEKSHPYGQEVCDGIVPGSGGAFFEIDGVRCLVLICADFWYASSFSGRELQLDVVIIPAFSFSQKPTPAVPRARWKHAAIARAYEYSTFIGISDWAFPVAYRDRPSSGAAGLAQPNPASATDLFQGVGRARTRAFQLDMETLRDLRMSRAQRCFCPELITREQNI